MHANQATLPAHPFLRHPRTLERVRALGFTKTGKVIWPVMGASPDDPSNPPAPTATAPTVPPAPQPAVLPAVLPAAPAPVPTPAQVFPPPSAPAPAHTGDTQQGPGTPWRELPLEDQVAYWQAQSRKHEGRQLSALGLKPGELDQLRARAAQSEQHIQTALTEAEQRGRTAAQAEFGLRLADAHIRMSIGERMATEQVDELIADLNLSRFVTAEHTVDAAKVSTFVSTILPAPAAPPTTTPPATPPAPTTPPPAVPPATGAQRQVPDMGQGTPTIAKPSGLEAGRLAAQARFGKNKQPGQ